MSRRLLGIADRHLIAMERAQEATRNAAAAWNRGDATAYRQWSKVSIRRWALASRLTDQLMRCGS